MVYRPLFFVWQDDKTAMDEQSIRDHQFMIGHSLMGTPVMTQYKDHVVSYFPKGTWYSLETGRVVASFDQTPAYRNITNGISARVPLFLRGGHIIYRQDTSSVLRTGELGNLFELVAGLVEVSPGVFVSNSTVVAIGDHNNEDLMEKCLKEIDCRFDISVLLNFQSNTMEIYVEGGDNNHDPDFLVEKISLYGGKGFGNYATEVSGKKVEITEDQTRSFITFEVPQKLKDLRLAFEFEPEQQENQQ